MRKMEQMKKYFTYENEKNFRNSFLENRFFMIYIIIERSEKLKVSRVAVALVPLEKAKR